MEIAKPVALTIDLGLVAKSCPPPHLVDRLMNKTPPASPTNKGTPSSTPQKLAVAVKLHEAHIQVRLQEAAGSERILFELPCPL